MSDQQLRAIIEKEAKILGLSAAEAIACVKNGQIGDNYLWQDLASLVYLLNE